MKQITLCLVVTLALAGIALALVFGGFIGVASGTIGGATLGLMTNYEVRKRDRRVRGLVCTAFSTDGDVVSAHLLAEVLGTPDVLTARRDHLSREATVLAQRYANGDASDY